MFNNIHKFNTKITLKNQININEDKHIVRQVRRLVNKNMRRLSNRFS